MATRARVPSRWVFLYLEKLKTARTEISGEELKKMGVPSGPIFKNILDKVLAARLDGEVGSKQEELKLAEKIWRGENR
jgi:tRNA nucleotidyltransferase (CCA-adding enzyme)